MCPFFPNLTGSSEFIVCGLGNPGSAYALTRHNAGFMAIDSLAASLGVKIDRLRHSALTARCEIGGRKGILLKPQTFMNNSGLSVSDASRYYRIYPHEIIVIYDDVSLPVGALRIRQSGSSGGHKGMNSIIDYLGTDDFPRIRIGIGEKPAGWDLADYVLGKLSPQDLAEIEKRFANLPEIVSMIIAGDTDKAMSKFNYNPSRSTCAEDD